MKRNGGIYGENGDFYGETGEKEHKTTRQILCLTRKAMKPGCNDQLILVLRLLVLYLTLKDLLMWELYKEMNRIFQCYYCYNQGMYRPQRIGGAPNPDSTEKPFVFYGNSFPTGAHQQKISISLPLCISSEH